MKYDVEVNQVGMVMKVVLVAMPIAVEALNVWHEHGGPTKLCMLVVGTVVCVTFFLAPFLHGIRVIFRPKETIQGASHSGANATK